MPLQAAVRAAELKVATPASPMRATGKEQRAALAAFRWGAVVRRCRGFPGGRSPAAPGAVALAVGAGPRFGVAWQLLARAFRRWRARPRPVRPQRRRPPIIVYQPPAMVVHQPQCIVGKFGNSPAGGAGSRALGASAKKAPAAAAAPTASRSGPRPRVGPGGPGSGGRQSRGPPSSSDTSPPSSA
mmetsp:Transcript_95144/g.306535  ORF Transcript_95144/g.306535 Transcript_95144/m.306535 type:complete len:185 (+) Transcript_95144:1594-2148(+)